jgi:FixJ family two-component response regulator
MPRPTVYVVDDDASIRRLLIWLMEKEGARVEGFASAESFLGAYEPDGPGPRCLVLDLSLGGLNGLDVQRQLKDRGVHIPVVFISGTAQVTQAVQAIKEGAVDFIVKPFDYRKVVEIISGCLQRNRADHKQRQVTETMRAHLAALTPREREVMDCVVAGKINRMIADELHVSIKTVEAHRARIMEKLQVHSVADLVRLTMTASTRLGFTLIACPVTLP